MFIPWNRYDQDAAAWILATEKADGEHLEVRVRDAMNQLILDLKSNSLWESIHSMVIAMGARTIAGAMVNIKTPAGSWTSNNFVSGDYNRTTGLVGNASTKYLDSGVAGDSMGRNDCHAFAHVHTITTTASGHYFGTGIISTAASTVLRRSSSTSTIDSRCRTSSTNSEASGHAVGLIGVSRSVSGSYTMRGNQTNSTETIASLVSNTNNFYFFSGNNGGTASAHCNARIRVCSVRAALTLSTAETVLDTYIASITNLSL